MKIKFIALSLCMVASVNIIKAQDTDRFLTNNRRKVLEGKGHISREAAVKKVSDIYAQFRKKQDADYISEFDRVMERYLKGGGNP